MRTRTVSPKALGLSRRRRLLELAGEVCSAPRLAIVGARAARRRYAQLVPAIVEAAAQRGLTIISGGALGIDTAVHRAALALNVAQLAIPPAAADAPYPPGNRRLFEEIVAHPGSGVVFVLRRGEQPSRGLFAGRNSYVVGLAEAVVVVEAGLRSGSMVSGRLALKAPRPLAALTGSPGCNALIGAGARAIEDGSPEQVRAAIGAWLDDPRGAPPADRWPEHLAELAAAIERAGERGLAIDDLEAPSLGLVALTQAEALGLIIDLGGGRYIRKDRSSCR